MLEASTFYLSSPVAPELVGEILPGAEIVCVVRDPVARAYSGYWHMRKKVPRRDMRSFRSIVDQLNGVDIEHLEHRERKEVEHAADRGLIDAEYLTGNYNERRGVEVVPGARFQDPLWCYKYFTVSNYSKYLRRWKRYNANVHEVVMERLIERPEETLRKLLAQFDLEPEATCLRLGHYNPTRVPRGPISRRVLRLGAGGGAIANLMNYLFRLVRDILYTCKPKLPDRTARAAAQVLTPEYRYWAERFEGVPELWSHMSFTGIQ